MHSSCCCLLVDGIHVDFIWLGNTIIGNSTFEGMPAEYQITHACLNNARAIPNNTYLILHMIDLLLCRFTRPTWNLSVWCTNVSETNPTLLCCCDYKFVILTMNSAEYLWVGQEFLCSLVNFCRPFTNKPAPSLVYVSVGGQASQRSADGYTLACS